MGYSALPAALDDDERKSAPTLQRRLELFLGLEGQRFIQTQSFRSLVVAVVVICILFAFLASRSSSKSLSWTANSRDRGDAQNWGDYVGRGLAREKVLASTPQPYNELGDRWIGGSGALYQALPLQDIVTGSLDSSARPEERGATLNRDGEFEMDGRRGILGGASVEWSTGVVGMGRFLGGVVDMRKRDPLVASTESATLPARDSLAAHILAEGWKFQDEEDRDDTEKMLKEARALGVLGEFPLRDRVRGDPVAQEAAAVLWSRIYSASEDDGTKSALEVVVEKLVRRVPVVIFSKSTCPHSEKVKQFFRKIRISPEPHIIEVDLRPDASSLKGLLTRRTLHATFPNIIIGGRSIGGSSDLEVLDASGELEKLLNSLKVVAHGR